MKNYNRLALLVVIISLPSLLARAQQTLNGDGWSVEISGSGKIISYKTINTNSEDVIQFRTDEYGGPAFEDVSLEADKDNPLRFKSEKEGLEYGLEYINENGMLAVIASVKNIGSKPHVPKYERLMLGLDTYMEKFPDWN